MIYAPGTSGQSAAHSRWVTFSARTGSAWVLVVHLSRVEIHESARRHGVADEDIEHAVVHSVTWVELGDDPPRYLLAGPERAGNLFELVVLVLGGDELVIHAMPLRRTTARALFGDER